MLKNKAEEVYVARICWNRRTFRLSLQDFIYNVNYIQTYRNGRNNHKIMNLYNMRSGKYQPHVVAYCIYIPTTNYHLLVAEQDPCTIIS